MTLKNEYNANQRYISVKEWATAAHIKEWLKGDFDTNITWAVQEWSDLEPYYVYWIAYYTVWDISLPMVSPSRDMDTIHLIMNGTVGIIPLNNAENDDFQVDHYLHSDEAY